MSRNGSATMEKVSAAQLQSLDQNESYHDATTATAPYRMKFIIEGVCPILFHRYDCDAVEAKGRAAKGSATKKTDDIESYYFRDEAGNVCVSGEAVHACLIGSARWDQDPRSARKSAMDLVKAGIVVESLLIPCTRDGKTIKTADQLAKHRVKVNQSAVPRVRPSLFAGWRAEFVVIVLASDLLSAQFVRNLMVRAGQLCGLHDFRPQYGRFQVVSADVLKSA